MKRFLHILIFTLLIVMALPIAAQEEDAPPEDLMALIAQSATEGSFVENEAGVTVLSLSGSPENLPMVLQAPAFGSLLYNAETFAFDWFTIAIASDEPVTTSAILQLDDLTIELLLTNPDYVDGVSTYEIAEDGIVSIEYVDSENKDTPELPESFTAASLFIPVDYAFMTQLLEGHALFTQGTRASGTQDDCHGWTCDLK